MLEDRIKEAYRALRLGAQMSKEYYDNPLIIAYSGGKDSDALINLALRCLKPDEFEVMNSHTTVDAPETVYHIREVLRSLEEHGVKTSIHKPIYKGKSTSMWKLIVDKATPPTRLFRYCCAVLKEASTPNRLVCTGVRKSESVKRKNRGSFEVSGKTAKDALRFSVDHAEEVFKESKTIDDENWDCNLIKNAKKKSDVIVNPIIEWTDGEVWDYLRDIKCKTNPLYQRGYERVGCIGCPLAGKHRHKEFADYPVYAQNYKRAFQNMLKAREQRGLKNFDAWTDAEHVFKWWMEDDTLDGQITIDEWMRDMSAQLEDLGRGKSGVRG